MSWETFSPLPLLEMVGGFEGRGFLAALMFPNGVEDDVMLAVAPEVVDAVRGGGRSADSRSGEEAFSVGLEGAGEGEGLSKTVSESTSASGVDGLEAMAREWEKSRPEMGGVLGRGRGEGEWRR
jgi:hypothetical protein